MSTLLTTTILIISLFLNNVFAYQFYCCYNIIRNTEEHKHEYTKEKFSGDSVKATVSNTITGDILRNNCVSKKTGSEIVGLVGGLSSSVTSDLRGLNAEKISSNVFNGQRLAENASRNNSTNVKPKTDKDGNVIPNKYLITDAKKDGDTGIYDQDGNKIGETLFDDTFIKYDVNGNMSGPATRNTINFDMDITEKIDNFVKQANGEYLLTWAYYKSRSNHEYDLKKSGEIKDYDGYVYNSKIVSGRGAGNILFGRNMENSTTPNWIIKPFAGFYHIYSNRKNIKPAQHFKNNSLKNFGETDETIKYIDYGTKQQRRH